MDYAIGFLFVHLALAIIAILAIGLACEVFHEPVRNAFYALLNWLDRWRP